MGVVATSWVEVEPSFKEPGLIVQFSQASGFIRAFAGGAPRVVLDGEDKYVYAKRLDLRSKVSTSASAANQLPSCMPVFSQISIPTYLNRTRAEYDHHDIAMAGKWGTSLVEAQRLAMRQGHFQLLRSQALYGNLPANGEGLVNTPGATAVTLPADSFGNTTVVAYDPGQMAQWLANQVLALKTATMQLGLPQRFVILGPQRTLGILEYEIVQLTSFQRTGAGSESVSGTLKEVLGWNGDTIEWTYDDTLIGMGAGGGVNDMVILTMPELKKPAGAVWNTNEFAEIQPSLAATTLIYSDVAAPIEIPTPIPGGAIDVLSEMRATPGWGIRPEAVRLLTIPY